MNRTSIEQSKYLLELGLAPESTDMSYPHLIRNGSDTYDSTPVFGEFDYPYEFPCWSYDRLFEILTENNIGFEYKHARLSGHENIEIEVFKFNEEEDYIFRKHFKSILEAVEYCLENGYIKKGE